MSKILISFIAICYSGQKVYDSPVEQPFLQFCIKQGSCSQPVITLIHINRGCRSPGICFTRTVCSRIRIANDLTIFSQTSQGYFSFVFRMRSVKS